MIKLFQYNWRIRDEWFDLCNKIPEEELLRTRIGGAGSILKTLFHIVDVEYSWIDGISGNVVMDPDYEDYKTLELVKGLSNEYRLIVQKYLDSWTDDMEYNKVKVEWMEDELYKGEVLRHIIAHEIHHIGQLSIWVREMGIKPISANFIHKGFM
ncbi:DinB family protein [Paenibacillus sp. GCM10028914]|uniref:DinB family protein n=1 Tax=Paenibacillus sp. GCM10028914 TaxID=3273416 RepID=UPI00361B70FB